MPALIYSLVSAVCFVFDLISFFILVGMVGKHKRAANQITSEFGDIDELPQAAALL